MKIHFLFHIGSRIIKRTGFALMIIIENSRAKQCAQCKALDVYERLMILHAFTGSVLPIWNSISCCKFEEQNITDYDKRVIEIKR